VIAQAWAEVVRRFQNRRSLSDESQSTVAPPCLGVTPMAPNAFLSKLFNRARWLLVFFGFLNRVRKSGDVWIR
jgi:hypothetical protein